MKLFVLPFEKSITIWILFALLISGCKQQVANETASNQKIQNDSSFEGDVKFLKKFTDIIVLQDASGKSKVAVSEALQGRVMTSTSEGDEGLSYGWINKTAFLSGDTSEHMNAFGGEDRIWLGPEGGQFSIYFEKGKEFNLDNWHVPRVIDIEPFNVASVSEDEAVFTKEARLTNYSGTIFQVGLQRKVKILDRAEALRQLGIDSANGISLVAYQTINELKNIGKEAWKKETGLLSIWILGMFNPSPGTTIIVPYQGKLNELRAIVNDTYFGRIPDDRLKLVGSTVFFKADGNYRSKIGLSQQHAPSQLGSYDSYHGVLTVVKYNRPEKITDYVNSLWEIQNEPYNGDAINAYNDGPPAPGAKPLGPFYELETSSPAAMLQPDSSMIHIHSTFHFKGSSDQLDPMMMQLFNVSCNDVATTF